MAFEDSVIIFLDDQFAQQNHIGTVEVLLRAKQKAKTLSVDRVLAPI